MGKKSGSGPHTGGFSSAPHTGGFSNAPHTSGSGSAPHGQHTEPSGTQANNSDDPYYAVGQALAGAEPPTEG